MSAPLRVLFVLRPDASERFGGDTTLARDNHAAVKSLGIHADLVESDRPDARGYDIAHVFNVGQPEVAARQIEACHAAGVAIALSPVWLDLRELEGRGRCYERLLVHSHRVRAIDAKLRRWKRERDPSVFLSRRQRIGLERHLQRQSELLHCAQVLLPNSALEARDCLVQLGVRDVPLVVVRIPASLEPERYWQQKRQGLVTVGRVETRKNQSALLYALRDETIPIDVVGATYDAGLQASCQRWCPRARFHGKLARQHMLALLGRAAVHALVSWCETAGVASLEAAIAGAHIVVSDRGAEVEYFGGDAEYADPADPESIRAAVVRALARKPRVRGDALDRRLRDWQWQAAAQETIRAYRIALGERAPAIG